MEQVSSQSTNNRRNMTRGPQRNGRPNGMTGGRQSGMRQGGMGRPGGMAGGRPGGMGRPGGNIPNNTPAPIPTMTVREQSLAVFCQALLASAEFRILN